MMSLKKQAMHVTQEMCFIVDEQEQSNIESKRRKRKVLVPNPHEFKILFIFTSIPLFLSY